MRAVVQAQVGVLDVPDLFAVVVGPASLLIDGDVVAWLTLEVPEAQRNHHVGSALARASLDEVRRHNIPAVRVAFDRGDPAALALVHDCGCPVATHAAGHSCVAQIDTRSPRQ